MAPTLEVATAVPNVDVLAVPVFSGPVLGAGGDIVDDAIDGTLAEFMAETGFEAKRGETLAVPTRGRLAARAALLVGVGDRASFDLAALRRAGALLSRRSGKVASLATTLLDAVPDDVDRVAAAQALAEGLELGAYQFLRYKSDAKPSKLERVVIVTRGGTRVRAAIERGARVAEAVSWARDLVNEPAAAKSPADVAEIARKVARARRGSRSRCSRASNSKPNAWAACSASGTVHNGRRGLCGSNTHRRARVPRWRSSARVSSSTPVVCR